MRPHTHTHWLINIIHRLFNKLYYSHTHKKNCFRGWGGHKGCERGWMIFAIGNGRCLQSILKRWSHHSIFMGVMLEGQKILFLCSISMNCITVYYSIKGEICVKFNQCTRLLMWSEAFLSSDAHLNKYLIITAPLSSYSKSLCFIHSIVDTTHPHTHTQTQYKCARPLVEIPTGSNSSLD